MKIYLACRLDKVGAFGFIKPIADLDLVESIDVFRDDDSLEDEKVKYHTPILKFCAISRQIDKLVQMLFKARKGDSVSVGIYEVPHGLIAFIVGKLRRIPVVICIISNPGYRKIRKGLRKWVMYYMLKHADFATVTGSNSKSILIKNGIKPDKIHILPNVFDSDHFYYENKPKSFDLISLGRLSPEKELIHFLHIVQKLKKTFPLIKVGIAGKGPDQMKIEMEIKKLDLADNVELLGYIKDAGEFYRSGRIFVLTSSTEGLPRSVIEAMACGVPCVASNVGDVSDIVIDKYNGFIVKDPFDAEEFTRKTELLLDDQEMYNRFSKNAVEYVNKNYNWHAAQICWKDILGKLSTTIQEDDTCEDISG